MRATAYGFLSFKRKCCVMADRVVLRDHCRCKCDQRFQSGRRGLVIGAVWGGEYDDGEGSGWGVNVTVGV